MSEAPFSPDELLYSTRRHTASELAAHLGVSRRLIYYYASRNEIHCDRTTRPRRFIASPDFIRTHKNQPAHSTSAAALSSPSRGTELPWTWTIRTRWAEFLDDPNRSRAARWILFLGSVASLVSLAVVFFPIGSSAQVAAISDQMRMASSQSANSVSDPALQAAATSIVGISTGSVDIDATVIAIQAFLRSSNTSQRLVAVIALSELERGLRNGDIRRPRTGFLSGRDLSDLDLSGHDFSGADLSGADFSRSTLRHVLFNATNLQGATFARSTVESSVIEHSKMDRAILSGCSFSKTLIVETSIQHARIDHCSFDEATIFASQLDSSYLNQASFHDTNIIASTFISVTAATFSVEGSGCPSGRGVDFSTAHFAWIASSESGFKPDTTLFPSLNVYTFSFPKGQKTSFANAKLPFTDFSGSCLADLDFGGAVLRGSRFDRVRVTGSTFGRADLSCTSFRGSDLRATETLTNAASVERLDISAADIDTEDQAILVRRGAIRREHVAASSATDECRPRAARLDSPLPKLKDADRFEQVIDLVPYADAPTEPSAAIRYFQRILEQKPTDVAALSGIGKAYYEIGAFDTALDTIRRALDVEPENVAILANIGVLYNAMGRPDMALTHLNDAIARVPDATLIETRGAAYIGLKRYKEALSDCSKAIELTPTSASAYACRGAVNASTGQLANAVADFSAALERAGRGRPADPVLAYAYRARAEAYQRLGRTQDAEADRRAAATPAR